jgi:hypothetical protein
MKTLFLRWLVAIGLLTVSFTSICQNTGYVKRFNGSPDWLEIAGKNSFGSTSDGGTLTLNKVTGNTEFKAFVFNRKGTNNTTMVAFRQDSASNSKSIAVILDGDSLRILRRTTKAGATSIVGRYLAPARNFWIKISRVGTTFTAYTSTSLPSSTTQTWTVLGTVNGAYTGWANSYWQALGVASQTSTLASTEFGRYAGGSWLGTITDTTTTTKPACNCGFSLVSVSQLTNTTGQFVYNSCGVSSLTWKLKATATSTVALATGTVSITSSTIGFTIPSTLTTGTYWVEATANNCTGTDVRSFVYTKGVLSVNTVSQTSLTAGSFSFTNCLASDNITWNLKNQAGAVQSTGTLVGVAPSTQNFTIPSGLATGTYSLEAVSSTCGTSAKSFSFLAGCDCGFTLQSASQISDTEAQFVYNSCSVTSLLWNLKNPGGQIIATNTITNPASLQSITLPANLANGTYTIEATPQNCGGFASRTFVYTKSVPYITVSPTSLNVASGASANYVSVSTNLAGVTASSSDNTWLSVTTCGTCGGGYYTVQTTATTSARTGSITFTSGSTSASLAVTQAAPVASSSVKSESNVAKTIPIIANGVTTLPLANFQSGTSTLTYLDAQQERRNSWGVWWHGGNVGFDSQNVMPWQMNLSGGDKFISHFGGFLTRGLDYVLTYNPDNGNETWTTDPQTLITYPPSGKSYNDFISRVQRYNRFDGQTMFMTDPDWSNEQWFDNGQGIGQNAMFGLGDNVERDGYSKSQRGLVSVDVEYYGKKDESMVSMLIGMATKTTGYVDEMYSNVSNLFGSVTYEPVKTSGSFIKRYIDYPDYPNYPQDAELQAIWDYRNPLRITLSSRGITNKSVLDYPNIQPSGEVSTQFVQFLPQGSTDIKFDGSTFVVNKFGAFNSWTVYHPMMHFGSLIEKWSEYSINRLGRRFKAMSKLISDKGVDVGSGGITERRNVIVNRKYGFLIGLLTYMNGADWHIWGEYSNANTSIDGYVGALAMLKMTRESGGIASFPEMTPQFWNSEYSLDGTTWKTTKAIDWADSMTDILPVRIKVGSGKMEVAAFRSEGVEPTEFWARAVVNGVMRTVHVTSGDWETTASDGTGKEYYYKMFTY